MAYGPEARVGIEPSLGGHGTGARPLAQLAVLSVGGNAGPEEGVCPTAFPVSPDTEPDCGTSRSVL